MFKTPTKELSATFNEIIEEPVIVKQLLKKKQIQLLFPYAGGRLVQRPARQVVRRVVAGGSPVITIASGFVLMRLQ